MKVNIRKISELTGFSPATVSNALNHKKGVNAETSARIIETAKELGYYVENKVSRVKFVMFKHVGSIVDNTPFFPQMLVGVEQECRLLGMDMIVQNLDRRSEDFQEQLQQLSQDRDSAVIFLGTEILAGDDVILQKLPQPFVVSDYWREDMTFDAVLINNADSARYAVNYLISKGHREIGYLRGSVRIKPFRTRSAGYRVAMEKAGLTIRDQYQVTLDPSMDGAYEDMKKYLATGPKLPTAFFADNDMIALGAMKAMWECGIRIPDDVSIVGFDDLSFSSISNPPLTTIRVPKADMGRVCVRRLRDMVTDSEGPHLKLEVCTQFVERESVRNLNTD